jgi:hypothetical protein
MAASEIPQNDHQRISARLGNLLLYGTFGLLMFGPLAFGAVEPWSIFLLETGAVALTLLWLAKQWLDDQIDLQWNPLFLPMAAFGALIVFRSSCAAALTCTTQFRKPCSIAPTA